MELLNDIVNTGFLSVAPWIAFAIILSVLVFVHELGHFVVAKWAGITVEEFAIGFPPRAVKVWQGEGHIKLDGVTYILGRKLSVPYGLRTGDKVYAETGTDAKGRAIVTRLEVVEPQGQAQPEQPNLQKSPTNSTVSIAERPTQTIEAMVKPTEYSINWIPLGGYVRMVGEEDPTDPGSFASKSKRVRLAVLVAGSGMNLVAAVFFFALTSMAGVPEPPTSLNANGEEAVIAQTIIDYVAPDTPAEAAGLQAGDILLGAGEVAFTHVGDVVDYVNERKGEEITLDIQRGEETLAVSLVPRLNPPPGQGSIGVGLNYDTDAEVVYYDAPQAVVKGVQDTATYVGLTFYIPYAILSQDIPAEAARPTGPVGISTQVVAASEASLTMETWYPVLSITAILSAALAVTNLLPLPALDGGRIFFIIIEAIRGKRVPPEREGAIHLIGLAMLMTLMIVITFYDVQDPIPAIPWETLFD